LNSNFPYYSTTKTGLTAVIVSGVGMTTGTAYRPIPGEIPSLFAPSSLALRGAWPAERGHTQG
jgi:hypothetical protein